MRSCAPLGSMASMLTAFSPAGWDFYRYSPLFALHYFLCQADLALFRNFNNAKFPRPASQAELKSEALGRWFVNRHNDEEPAYPQFRIHVYAPKTPGRH